MTNFSYIIIAVMSDIVAITVATVFAHLIIKRLDGKK